VLLIVARMRSLVRSHLFEGEFSGVLNANDVTPWGWMEGEPEEVVRVHGDRGVVGGQGIEVGADVLTRTQSVLTVCFTDTHPGFTTQEQSRKKSKCECGGGVLSALEEGWKDSSQEVDQSAKE